MILHLTSTIEITSYRDLEEKMKTQQKIFMNRELSWLKFNERVLEEAENREVPLCERLTFASIYQSNLDEFFMVRVGSLIDQMLLDKNMKENKTKMTPQEQIDAIIPQVQKLNRRKDSVYEEMMDSLKEHNIHLVNFQKISKKESEYLRAYFQAEIAPLISPTIIGKRQPFPFLKNKEIYAVAVLETKNGKEKLINKLIETPCISQMKREAEIANRICSPTSMTMLLNRLGENLLVEDVAYKCFDYKYNEFGNWSYNVAYAGSLGYKAYIQFGNIDLLINELNKGYPVEVSVKYTNDINNKLYPYIILGLTLWIAVFYSGIHSTLSGVLLAFSIPVLDDKNRDKDLSYKIQHKLELFSNFIILPLFAFVNTGISLSGNLNLANDYPLMLGIILGLVIGKPLGIMLFGYLGVLVGITQKPENASWYDVLEVSILAGIGFTMSLFVAEIAFFGAEVELSVAKISVLIASFISIVLASILTSIGEKVQHKK